MCRSVDCRCRLRQKYIKVVSRREESRAHARAPTCRSTRGGGSDFHTVLTIVTSPTLDDTTRTYRLMSITRKLQSTYYLILYYNNIIFFKKKYSNMSIMYYARWKQRQKPIVGYILFIYKYEVQYFTTLYEKCIYS